MLQTLNAAVFSSPQPQVLSILQKANMKDVLFYNKIEELSLSTIGTSRHIVVV